MKTTRSFRCSASSTRSRADPLQISAELRLTVAGALQLEETVGLRDQRQAVKEPPSRLTFRRRGDHRTEDRVPADADDRRAHVQSHLVEGFVMRCLDDVVELG